MAIDFSGAACAWRGIAFGMIQTDGPRASEPGQATNYDARDAPGGDVTSLQIGGRKSGEYTREIALPTTSWAAFKATVRQSGTLTVAGVSWTATLLGWAPPRRGDDEGAVLVGVTWYI